MKFNLTISVNALNLIHTLILIYGRHIFYILIYRVQIIWKLYSNQHVQGSCNEETRFTSAHITSFYAQMENVTPEYADSHSIPTDLEVEEVKTEKGISFI